MMTSEHYRPARGNHVEDAHWCYIKQQRLLRKFATRWPRDDFGIRNNCVGHPGVIEREALQQAGPRSRSPSSSGENEQRSYSSSGENEKSSYEVISYGTFDEYHNRRRNVQYFSYYSFPPFSQAEEGIGGENDRIVIRPRQRSRQTLAVCACHLVSMMIFFGLIMLVVVWRNMPKGDGGIAGFKQDFSGSGSNNK